MFQFPSYKHLSRVQADGLQERGFTLIELLIVIVIITVLGTIIWAGTRSSKESAAVVEAGFTQQEMASAAERYYSHMGFYPPDVTRGWDPGFVQSLPWNADEAAGNPPPGGYALPGTNCGHCPSNWQTIVQQRWKGPYLTVWPRFTPWKGKYDYNYWGSGATRPGNCIVPKGIYVGVQGDYNNNNTIPQSAEQKMIERGYDADNCMNGESQVLLWSLQ